MSKGWDGTVDGVLKEFIPLVAKSPVAIATLVLSTFFGYGISFIIFEGLLPIEWVKLVLE
jgi:hypothetical protein